MKEEDTEGQDRRKGVEVYQTTLTHSIAKLHVRDVKDPSGR